jgi:hypothetical protein
MMNDNRFIFQTFGIKRSQTSLLILSISFFFIASIILIKDLNSNNILFGIFILCVLLLVNLLYKNYFDIAIDKKTIFLSSLWKTKSYKITDLCDIDQPKFTIFVLLNPCIRLIFKDGHKAIAFIPGHRSKFLFNIFSYNKLMSTYIISLKRKIMTNI